MIRIGTSGYSFSDWVGTVYPAEISSRQYLEYYNNILGFCTVEINFSFYMMPSTGTFLSMSKRVKDDFIFFVKAYRGFTHEINIDSMDIMTREFQNALNPLIERDSLGGILFQFPYSFWNNLKNRRYLLELKHYFSNIPIFVEFRNSSWNEPAIFDFLKINEIGVCIVDAPALKGLFPLVYRVTNNIAYFRFHGRNKHWFRSSMAERYNYDYSEDELKELAELIKKANSESDGVFVFFNNCHAGQAVKNALEMMKLLGL